MSTEAAVLIVLAIAVLWFMARWQAGRTGGGLSLGFFRREKRETVPGLGPKAIRTLLDDTIALVKQEPGLAGLVLAGPFAGETAEAASTVSFIIPTSNPDAYAGRDWLVRWPYPGRGHVVQQMQSASDGASASHRLSLRGAPPIAFHFVSALSSEPPPAVADAFAEGALALETGTTAAKTLIARWKQKQD